LLNQVIHTLLKNVILNQGWQCQRHSWLSQLEAGSSLLLRGQKPGILQTSYSAQRNPTTKVSCGIFGAAVGNLLHFPLYLELALWVANMSPSILSPVNWLDPKLDKIQAGPLLK
jgi:hypothetical protein